MKAEEKRTLWLEHVSAYRASNLSAEDWCEQNGVKVNSLRRWITKFNKEDKDSSQSNEWLAVKLPNSFPKKPDQENASGIRINIGHASIDISSEFDSSTLERVIGILSKQC